jgi:hypothetical protein
MTLPGFNAETSLCKTSLYYRLTSASAQVDGMLYGTGIQYRGMRASVQASGVMPQQLPHLFCRPTDCPCQKAACIRGGGIVAPSQQPPCFFTCNRR